MAVLLGVRETSMAKDNATNVTLQLGVTSLRCCTCYCGAARVATTLQLVLLQRCGVASCGAPSCDAAALQATTLWRCNSHGCNAAALWHYSSRCCTAVAGYNATALRVATTLQRCSSCVFFWNDFWQVQESPTSSCMCEKEGNKEQERTRDNFETCFGLALPSSSALV